MIIAFNVFFMIEWISQSWNGCASAKLSPAFCLAGQLSSGWRLFFQGWGRVNGALLLQLLQSLGQSPPACSTRVFLSSEPSPNAPTTSPFTSPKVASLVSTGPVVLGAVVLALAMYSAWFFGPKSYNYLALSLTQSLRGFVEIWMRWPFWVKIPQVVDTSQRCLKDADFRR